MTQTMVGKMNKSLLVLAALLLPGLALADGPVTPAGTSSSTAANIQGVTGGVPVPVTNTGSGGSVTQGTSPWVTSDNGTKITAATMPSGGVGVTGWLSAIFNALGSPFQAGGNIGNTSFGVSSLPGSPMQQTGGSVTTSPGQRTLVPLDIASVTTGGSAVTALAAGHSTAGGFIYNPTVATVALCINQIGTASGVTSAGNTTCIQPGQPYNIVPSANAVSVISSDSTHAFSGMGLQ